MANHFKLTHRQLIDIASTLKERVTQGLLTENQEIRCIPTFVPLKNIPKHGRALVLDFGGTNIRASIVSLKNNRLILEAEPVKKTIRTTSEGTLDREKFLSIVAELIASLSPPDNLPLGYCFSYPAQSTIDGDAILIKWTKEISVRDTVNERMGALLIDYLKSYKQPIICSKAMVINDTIASLLSGMLLSEADGYIGLIVGTGTNMAALIDARRIPKLSSVTKWNGPIPVNLESGNFHPPHLNTWDNQLDENPNYSEKPGEQRFEKAVAGAYLATLMKLAYPAANVDPRLGSQDVVRIAKSRSVNGSKEVQLARNILDRSARLVAASLTGLIDLLSANSDYRKICIAAEGSLFWGYEAYVDIVRDTIYSLLRTLSKSELEIKIASTENANLLGSAIAALAE